MQTIQMQLAQKQKAISQLICAFFLIYIKFWTFSKKHDSHSLCISRNYGHRKSWLDKCPKSTVWEDSSRGNVVNGPKHWFNLNGSTFTISTDHCDGNGLAKSLP